MIMPLVPPAEASAKVAIEPAFLQVKVPVPSGVMAPGVVAQTGGVAPDVPVVFTTWTLPLLSRTRRVVLLKA
jgi:hypothetical protein